MLTSGWAEQSSTKAWGLHAKFLICWDRPIHARPPASDTEAVSGAPVLLNPQLPAGGRGQVHGIVSPVTHLVLPQLPPHPPLPPPPLITGCGGQGWSQHRLRGCHRKVGTGERRGRCGAGSAWGVACPLPWAGGATLPRAHAGPPSWHHCPPAASLDGCGAVRYFPFP